MDRIFWMECFARAVETGSFSAVAREFSIGQPNVSRHIAALEDHLGARLLHRSTRRLTLTSEGERYYEEIRRVLEALGEAESHARGENAPQGLLKVACPVSLGQQFMLPLVKDYLKTYPDVEVDLRISDSFIDLIEEGIDVALRIGPLKDSALTARRVGTSERVCVATKQYLEKHPKPKTPADLAAHQCVLYSLSSGGNVWPFSHGDVSVNGRLRVNSLESIRTAVLDGFGVGYVPVWMFQAEIVKGTVIPLLLDYPSPPGPINLVYSTRRLLPQRTIVFMNMAAEAFAQEPALNAGSLRRLIGKKRAN